MLNIKTQWKLLPLIAEVYNLVTYSKFLMLKNIVWHFHQKESTIFSAVTSKEAIRRDFFHKCII